MKTFLFILQYDSFVATYLPVIRTLISGHHVVDVVLITRKSDKNWIGEKVLADLADIPHTILPEKELNPVLDKQYNVCVLGTTPRKHFTRITRYVRKKGYATRFVSGYVGMMLKNERKGFLRGVKRRALTDLIFTPGEEARGEILATGYIDTEKTRIESTGIPRFDALYREIQNWQRTPEKEILFLEQPTFPESKKERIDLARKLAELARSVPDYRVIVKPRFSVPIGHAHQPKYYIPQLIKEIHPPDNLIITDTPMYQLFQTVAYVLTISSTGGLEAVLARIPSYFMEDWCGGEKNRYGSQDFLSLGRNATFAQLTADPQKHFNHIQTVNDRQYEMAERILRFDGQNGARLADALLRLAGEAEI